MDLREVAFYFVRHGETDWNREHRAQGRRDIPLNETGWSQARLACDLVRPLTIATICSSPLRRALDTARLLGEATGADLVVLDELVECSWGEAEGKVRGSWFDEWKAGTRNPRGAEPYAAFLERARHAINRALAMPGPVLVVAHGGIYWAILRYGRLGAEFDIPNGVPVHHEPPRDGSGRWTATILDGAR